MHGDEKSKAERSKHWQMQKRADNWRPMDRTASDFGIGVWTGEIREGAAAISADRAVVSSSLILAPFCCNQFDIVDALSRILLSTLSAPICAFLLLVCASSCQFPLGLLPANIQKLSWDPLPTSWPLAVSWDSAKPQKALYVSSSRDRTGR